MMFFPSRKPSRMPLIEEKGIEIILIITAQVLFKGRCFKCHYIHNTSCINTSVW